MADNKVQRVNPAVLEADLEAFQGLQTINGYAPGNQSYSAEIGQGLHNALQQAQIAEKQASAAYSVARDTLEKSEADFHNFIQGVKKQVIAQFGDDSNEIMALGLKRKSDYKRGKKKATVSEPKPQS